MRIATRFPLERIAVLDRAIRAGEYPNAGTIAGRLEVCRRTVQRDVEFLRDRLGAPLAFDPRRNGYYYRDPSYRLPHLTITEGELVALLLAERVLQQYQGTSYAQDLARAFAKITAGLSDHVTVDLQHLADLHSFRTSVRAPVEPELFRELVGAAARRRRVVMDYWTASRDAVGRREVDPYHLASVDGQWYLIAYCHVRQGVKIFVPGRIRSLRVTEATFDPPADFRVEDYLAHSFAILRGDDGEVHRVRLRFSGEAVRYVRERTWHPSQTAEETPEGDLIVGFEVSHLREVERWVLSWGRDCLVLGSEALRDRVAKNLAEAAGFYLQPTEQPGKHSTNIDERIVTRRAKSQSRRAHARNRPGF